MRLHAAAAAVSLLLSSTASLSLSQTPVRFELANGLRVWIQEDHRRPVALVQTTYKFGSINESPGTTGTAHYIEHMVYRATENVHNEDQYGYNDRIGGRWTGGTSSLSTSYGETVPSWALESALKVTADRMGGRALFDTTEFKRERNNVVTEANGFSRTDPMSAFRDAVMLASFEVHPYRYTSNTWSRDNLDIIRDDAYNLYRRFYGPNNAVVVITGDVNVADARRLVEQYFAPLRRAPESGEVRVVEPPQRAEKRVTLSYTGDRKQLNMVYRAPQAAHADYPVLVVLDRVLSARLEKTLPAAGAADIATSHNATPYPNVYSFTASTAANGDLEGVVRAIQVEIDRLRTQDVPADELAAARVDRPQAGRGGRGGRGGGNQAAAGGGRQTIAQIATQLGNREVFPWEVSPEVREHIRVAQATVTPAQIKAYADRWLRTSQRTIGFLVPGGDNFMPVWSDGRPVVGERMEVPPLTVMPAKRMQPEPVPARALEPLGKLSLAMDRRALANGVVVRAARSDGPNAALRVRVNLGANADPPGKEGLGALVARLIAGDSALKPLTPRVTTNSLSSEGYFDIALNVPTANLNAATSAVAHALRTSAFSAARIDAERAQGVPAGGGGRGGRGGNAAGGAVRGANSASETRSKVLQAVAPTWRTNDGATPASLAAITAVDVNAFLAKRLGGGSVTVSVVGPSDPAALIDGASKSFAALRKSGTPTATASRSTERTAAATQEERIAQASETQVTVLAGLPAVSRRDPDYRALVLLNYIAGAPFYGGRLGWALTKAGLTYESTATTTGGANTGFITFSTNCDTRNLESTVQAIREVVQSIAERGVDDWEVKEAKGWTLGRMLLNGPREDAGEDALAAALLESETTGDEQLDLPAFSKAYLDITPAQVNAAAKKYYRPDLLKVVAIGAIPTGPTKMIFPAGTFKALFER